MNEGNQSDSEDDEESLIKYYFTRGFQYDAIVDFLSKRHGYICLSEHYDRVYVAMV